MVSIICTLIANGTLPTCAVRLLTASRLIALPKPNGDVRPIAIGECLRRLTARVLCAKKKKDFSDFFAPLQYGVATEGGSELLIHQIQLLLESNKDWVVLKSDVKNVFNTINRSDMIDQVFASFPDIGNHVVRMYSAFSDLVISRGNSTVILSSQEGVHQGDPLGPVLFSIAIHSVLLDLQSAHRDFVVLAYLDDIFYWVHQARQCWHLMISSLPFPTLGWKYQTANVSSTAHLQLRFQ